ncbi:MAG: helix-turn-helix transcriptional regulator [Bacteroidetes bacterium]|nr:helix-turn-helix transcriptional regulator [Bacteroidota bacterium]
MLEYFKTFSVLATMCACLFWAVALFFKYYKKFTSHTYVLLLLSVASFVYLMVYAKFHEHFGFYSYLFPIQSFAVLCLWPLFYLFVHALTKNSPDFKLSYLLHFVFPLLMGITMFVLLYFWMDKDEMCQFISRHIYGDYIEGVKFKVGWYIYSIGKVAYLITSAIYTWFIYQDYKNHIKNSKDLFSNENSSDIKWVKSVVILYLFLFCFHVIIQVFSNEYVASHPLLIGVSYFIFAVFFFALGYFSFTQKQLYEPFSEVYEDEESKSNIVSSDEIKNYLIRQKPYLNPDYSLYDLCLHFNTNRTYLSQLINKDFSVNFRTMINTYRLSEAKALLYAEIKKNTYVSLEYVAAKSGFNSYSTFSRVFKQIEGISPQEYKEIIAKKISNDSSTVD